MDEHQPVSGLSWLARWAPVWQGLLAVMGIGGAIAVWPVTLIPKVPWLSWVIAGVLALLGVGSGLAAVWLGQRRARGWVLALVVNYIGAILVTLALFQSLNFFLGIDALAEHFGRGLPALAGVLLGYLIYALGDRFPHHYRREKLYRRSGKAGMGIAGLIFVLVTHLIPWFIGLLPRWVTSPLNLGLTLVAGLMGLATWLLMRDGVAQRFNATQSQTEAVSGLMFLAPNLLGFLLFFAGPLLFSFYVSLTDWDAFGTKNWVGLANYQKIFALTVAPLETATQPVTEVLDTTVYDELTRFSAFGHSYVIGARDRLFWIALRNTIVFGLLVLPLSIIPALFLANVLNTKLPGMRFFRAVYFLPSIAAVVGVALIWQWLYNATVGYINYFITVGVNFLNTVLGLGWADPQIKWLSDTRTALLAIVIMTAWQTMGFNSVLFLAGLQNIPGELYEAATVDGAGSWHRFWKITLPLLAPTTFFVVSTTAIQALQAFEQVFIATNPPGGPNNATLTVVLYLYQNGFQRFKQGYAAATAWVLFLVIFVITMLQFRRQRASEMD